MSSIFSGTYYTLNSNSCNSATPIQYLHFAENSPETHFEHLNPLYLGDFSESFKISPKTFFQTMSNYISSIFYLECPIHLHLFTPRVPILLSAPHCSYIFIYEKIPKNQQSQSISSSSDEEEYANINNRYKPLFSKKSLLLGVLTLVKFMNKWFYFPVPMNQNPRLRGRKFDITPSSRESFESTSRVSFIFSTEQSHISHTGTSSSSNSTTNFKLSSITTPEMPYIASLLVSDLSTMSRSFFEVRIGLGTETKMLIGLKFQRDDITIINESSKFLKFLYIDSIIQQITHISPFHLFSKHVCKRDPQFTTNLAPKEFISPIKSLLYHLQCHLPRLDLYGYKVVHSPRYVLQTPHEDIIDNNIKITYPDFSTTTYPFSSEMNSTHSTSPRNSSQLNSLFLMRNKTDMIHSDIISLNIHHLSKFLYELLHKPSVLSSYINGYFDSNDLPSFFSIVASCMPQNKILSSSSGKYPLSQWPFILPGLSLESVVPWLSTYSWEASLDLPIFQSIVSDFTSTIFSTSSNQTESQDPGDHSRANQCIITAAVQSLGSENAFQKILVIGGSGQFAHDISQAFPFSTVDILTLSEHHKQICLSYLDQLSNDSFESGTSSNRVGESSKTPSTKLPFIFVYSLEDFELPQQLYSSKYSIIFMPETVHSFPGAPLDPLGFLFNLATSMLESRGIIVTTMVTVQEQYLDALNTGDILNLHSYGPGATFFSSLQSDLTLFANSLLCPNHIQNNFATSSFSRKSCRKTIIPGDFHYSRSIISTYSELFNLRIVLHSTLVDVDIGTNPNLSTYSSTFSFWRRRLLSQRSSFSDQRFIRLHEFVFSWGEALFEHFSGIYSLDLIIFQGN